MIPSSDLGDTEHEVENINARQRKSEYSKAARPKAETLETSSMNLLACWLNRCEIQDPADERNRGE
jgi:hypothetical protein